MRTTTADRYRTRMVRNFDAAWTHIDGSRVSIIDVDIRKKDGMVVLTTAGGLVAVAPDHEVCISSD